MMTRDEELIREAQLAAPRGGSLVLGILAQRYESLPEEAQRILVESILKELSSCVAIVGTAESDQWKWRPLIVAKIATSPQYSYQAISLLANVLSTETADTFVATISTNVWLTVEALWKLKLSPSQISVLCRSLPTVPAYHILTRCYYRLSTADKQYLVDLVATMPILVRQVLGVHFKRLAQFGEPILEPNMVEQLQRVANG